MDPDVVKQMMQFRSQACLLKTALDDDDAMFTSAL